MSRVKSSNSDRRSLRNAGRRTAGTYDRTAKKYQKRIANKATRRTAKKH